MSVRIDIGPYRLESYSHGWTTGEPRARTDGEGGQGEYLVSQSFHGSLATALMSLQETWLRDSSATSFEEVLSELKSFRAELMGLFKIEVREPDRDRHRRKVSA